MSMRSIASPGRSSGITRNRLPENLALCCDAVNRGLAAFGDRLYMCTLDAHLVCLDKNTGEEIWDEAITAHGKDGEEEKDIYKMAYSATVAPLIVKGKVIIGISGAEYGIRGFIDAYDAKTGKREWRFYTVPAAEDEAEHCQKSHENLGGPIVVDRRRVGLGHRHVRSGFEHAVLGHRQSFTRLQRRQSAKGTTSTPAPSWLSTPTTARTNGIFKTVPMIFGITMA